MATIILYPSLNKEDLRKVFVGRSIKDVPAPAAVLDVSKVKRNCSDMLEAVRDLNFGWRAHIKTHKVSLKLFPITSFIRYRLRSLAP